jgi:hypothetical protein
VVSSGAPAVSGLAGGVVGPVVGVSGADGGEVDGVAEDEEGQGLPWVLVAPPEDEGHGLGDFEGGSSENDVDADGEGWLTGGVVFLSFPPVSPTGRVNHSSCSGS